MIGFCILIISIGIGLAIADNALEAKGFLAFAGGGICGIFLCLLLDVAYEKPTAIDVYKGRTTLEITYRDSIPVDTAVVFKK